MQDDGGEQIVGSPSNGSLLNLFVRIQHALLQRLNQVAVYIYPLSSELIRGRTKKIVGCVVLPLLLPDSELVITSAAAEWCLKTSSVATQYI